MLDMLRSAVISIVWDLGTVGVCGTCVFMLLVLVWVLLHQPLDLLLPLHYR